MKTGGFVVTAAAISEEQTCLQAALSKTRSKVLNTDREWTPPSSIFFLLLPSLKKMKVIQLNKVKKRVWLYGFQVDLINYIFWYICLSFSLLTFALDVSTHWTHRESLWLWRNPSEQLNVNLSGSISLYRSAKNPEDKKTRVAGLTQSFMGVNTLYMTVEYLPLAPQYTQGAHVTGRGFIYSTQQIKA